MSVLHKRREVYEAARRQHAARWSVNVCNWGNILVEPEKWLVLGYLKCGGLIVSACPDG